MVGWIVKITNYIKTNYFSMCFSFWKTAYIDVETALLQWCMLKDVYWAFMGRERGNVLSQLCRNVLFIWLKLEKLLVIFFLSNKSLEQILIFCAAVLGQTLETSILIMWVMPCWLCLRYCRWRVGWRWEMSSFTE